MHVGSARALSVAAASDAGETPVLDVLVIGGGIAGSLLLSELAVKTRGLRLGVVEPRTPPTVESVASNPIPDLRVFAITPASADALRSAGVWERLRSVRAPAYTSMQVWESTGTGHVRFEASDDPLHPESLGFVLEDRLLQAVLLERVQELARGAVAASDAEVHFLCPAKIAGLTLPRGAQEPRTRSSASAATSSSSSSSSSEDLAVVKLDNGKTIRARLVVGADGAMSATRQLAGIGSWGSDYQQKGVVATVRTNRPNNRTAWQRFLPSGPIALLPLWDDLSSIVWSTTPAHADELLRLAPAELAAEVHRAFHRPPSGDPFGADHHPEAEAEAEAASSSFSSSSSPSASSWSLAKELETSARFATRAATTVATGVSATVGQLKSGGGSAAAALGPLAKPASMLKAVLPTSMPAGLPSPLSILNSLTTPSASSSSSSSASSTSSSSSSSGWSGDFVVPPAVTEVVGSVAAFPLRLHGVHTFVKPRLALIGDAAHVIHPLAGQGLNLGIGDVVALSNLVRDAVAVGADVGSLATLQPYHRARQMHALAMVTAMDVIKGVYAAGGAEPGPWSALRTLGMGTLNAAGPLKLEMSRFAMGSGSSALVNVLARLGKLGL